MTPNWYYVHDGQAGGPVPYAQLQQMAAVGALSPRDMVMNDGTNLWVSAHVVPGLIFTSPPATPAATCRPPNARQLAEWQRLRAIAKWQRWLNVTSLIAVLVYSTVPFRLSQPQPLVLLTVDVFGTVVLVWVTVRLAHALGLILWIFIALVFLQVVYLFLLLVLSSEATEALRTTGVSVGFLGPMFLLVVNLFVLLVLSSEATEALRTAGVRVGFLGTTLPEQPPPSFVHRRVVHHSRNARIRE
jgi:hypothetical protein